MTEIYRETLQKGSVSIICKSGEDGQNQQVMTFSFSVRSPQIYKLSALYRGVRVNFAPDRGEPVAKRGPRSVPSETRNRVLRHLAQAGWFLSPGEIATGLGIKRNAADQTLYRMLKAGEIVKVGRGKYGLPQEAVR